MEGGRRQGLAPGGRSGRGTCWALPAPVPGSLVHHFALAVTSPSLGPCHHFSLVVTIQGRFDELAPCAEQRIET